MLSFKNKACNAQQKAKSEVSKGMLLSSFRIFALSGILMSYAYATTSNANEYIEASIAEMFDNTSNFECEGGKRSAECRVDRYEINDDMGLALRNYRYTVDYQTSRVIERISSNVEVASNYEYREFLPKHFECSDFTQIHNDKKQINEQLVCSFSGDLYRVWFRLRAKATSPLFSNIDSMGLMKKSTIVLNVLTKELTGSIGMDEKSALTRVFKDFDVNLYGIDVYVTKPKLPQKIYEYMFGDIIDDEKGGHNRLSQMSKTAYNSGVGYIYGNIMGYVWGNDTIDDRTKQSLNNLFVALRDSAMLDSDIRSVYINIVNRTKDGFNLGDVVATITDKSALNVNNLDKHMAGKVLNLFSGDVLNRYRIEAQALKSKNHDY